MAMNPMDAFSVGQKIGKSKRSTFGMTSDTLMDNFQTRQKAEANLSPALTGAAFKEQLERTRPMNPKENSEIDKNRAMASSYGNGRNVFERNPNTGELNQIGQIGRFDRVLSQNTPSGAEAASLSDIDEVLKTLPNVRNKLKGDPGLAMTGNIPFVNPDYKSDYDYLTKTLASIVGGKNLTLPERNIVQTNLPATEDMFDTPTLMKKLDRIERVMNGVKSRMAGGSFQNPLQQAAGGGQPRADMAPDASSSSPDGSNQDPEETLFQRLKVKHGTK